MTTSPDISFVVPTYSEADNLPLLVDHIKHGLNNSGLNWQLIIANDESGDATVQVCERLAVTDPVILLNRTTNRGLSQAVIDGATLASGEFIVVMDGDLSHPSTLVADMIARLRAGEADLIIGSRKIAQASTDEHWPVLRHIGTFCATALARPLVRIHDPLAGFFALRRDAWPTVPLWPIGYKICLELIVRGKIQPERILELPIHFTDRKVGESKMGAHELHNYLRHILNLYRFRWPALRMVIHASVGGVGLVIDLLVYLLLLVIGVPHLSARMISFWPACVVNWLLNRLYTYDDRPQRAKPRQLFEFIQLSLLGFAVNSGTYYLLIEHVTWFDKQHIAALITGVIIGLVVNFAGSNLLVFGKNHARPKSSS